MVLVFVLGVVLVFVAIGLLSLSLGNRPDGGVSRSIAVLEANAHGVEAGP